MKLQFKKQEFQDKAVMSVVDLFRGAKNVPTTFSMQKLDILDYSKDELLGYGNNLDLSMEQIEKNMHEIQDRNLLPLTDLTELRFNIEMETGTGKTYVYTKTILELNKKYGFTKFIIVVPSIAIKEGVYKSFQVTEEHFKSLYNNVPYHYFIYDSKKRNDVVSFDTNVNIEIMIVTIGAFISDFGENSKKSNLYI